MQLAPSNEVEGVWGSGDKTPRIHFGAEWQTSRCSLSTQEETVAGIQWLG
jgi:hypothetical protein